MATFSGNDGVARIGSNAFAEVRSFTINQTSDTISDTAMGDSWNTHLAGLKSWDGSIELMWDDTDATGQETAVIGASLALELYPEGITTGDYKLSGTATVTSLSQTQSYDNSVVTRSITVVGNGALTIGTAT